MLNSKCKICRRLGVKLFLKGERCLSPKCAMVKRAYPVRKRGKRRTSSLSEYGKELREKQKLKNWYNLSEKQFQTYVKKILKKGAKEEDTATLLIRKLEKRLDNVIFRLGFTSSRVHARQLVNHRHFFVNDKKVNIPSYQVKKGDKISVHPSSAKLALFQALSEYLKKYQTPSWIKLDAKKMEGKIIGEPSIEEVSPPVEMSAIFEYYSR